MARKVFIGNPGAAGRIDLDLLGDVVDRARERMLAQRLQDPEWCQARLTLPREILQAFSYAVLQSDQWFESYRVPWGFEEVCNHLARSLQETYREPIRVSLVDIQRIIVEALRSCVTWRAWGGDPEAIVLISHETPDVTPERVPLDLDAVVTNACVLIRDFRRTWDARERAAKEAREE